MTGRFEGMKYHSYRKNSKVLKAISGAVYDLPVPVNISYLWNFGSLMGFCLVLQIVTGLFLSIHYTPHEDHAFNSVWRISRTIQNGWLIRSFHANGASGFFFCIYIHICRGIYYHSFSMSKTWWSGAHLYIVLMAIAFTGYVLPWAQMSFWGATVITNMITAVPFIGNDLVKYIWGGEIVGDATLKRFFIFHFICPFLLGVMSLVHMVCLHETGSSNPLGVSSKCDCLPFYPYFVLKDFFGLVLFTGGLAGVVFLSPDLFGVPENFIRANPMKTSKHIEPEWYFLFAYSILRSVQHKAGGICLMLGAVLLLYILPFFKKPMIKGVQYNFVGQVYFWVFVFNFVFLTIIGMKHPDSPFNEAAFWGVVTYYIFFTTYVPASRVWEKFSMMSEPVGNISGGDSNFSRPSIWYGGLNEEKESYSKGSSDIVVDDSLNRVDLSGGTFGGESAVDYTVWVDWVIEGFEDPYCD